jgi:hypothetical protein
VGFGRVTDGLYGDIVPSNDHNDLSQACPAYPGSVDRDPHLTLAVVKDR